MPESRATSRRVSRRGGRRSGSRTCPSASPRRGRQLTTTRSTMPRAVHAERAQQPLEVRAALGHHPDRAVRLVRDPAVEPQVGPLADDVLAEADALDPAAAPSRRGAPWRRRAVSRGIGHVRPPRARPGQARARTSRTSSGATLHVEQLACATSSRSRNADAAVVRTVARRPARAPRASPAPQGRTGVTGADQRRGRGPRRPQRETASSAARRAGASAAGTRRLRCRTRRPRRCRGLRRRCHAGASGPPPPAGRSLSSPACRPVSRTRPPGRAAARQLLARDDQPGGKVARRRDRAAPRQLAADRGGLGRPGIGDRHARAGRRPVGRAVPPAAASRQAVLDEHLPRSRAAQPARAGCARSASGSSAAAAPRRRRRARS